MTTKNTFEKQSSKYLGITKTDGVLEVDESITVSGTISGIVSYFFLAVNNATGTYTAVSDSESIIEQMSLDQTQFATDGIPYTIVSPTNTYLKPSKAGLYQLTFNARLKDADQDQVNGVIPYIYADGDAPASWIVSTGEPQYIGGLYGDRCTISYSQPILVETASGTRIDLRASVESGTLNIAFGWCLFKYISAL